MTFFIFVILMVFVISVARAAGTKRRFELMNTNRRCSACGIEHPPFANYCGRCGKAL